MLNGLQDGRCQPDKSSAQIARSQGGSQSSMYLIAGLDELVRKMRPSNCLPPRMSRSSVDRQR